MTKNEYQEYIASADWQERRSDFLKTNNICVRCEMPRWLAEIAYDQDLNVHHKSYESLGDEDWDHLESLCRRCHEIHKFGRSELREPKSAICENCKGKHWNPYSNFCVVCDTVFGSRYIEKESKIGKSIGYLMTMLLTCFWVQRGCSREVFMREIAHVYKLGEDAAPRIEF
jgi:hypothetical protein